MATVSIMTADELFDVAIDEGRRLVKIAADPCNRNGPFPTVMDNALGGIEDIFNFLVDQRNKEKEAAKDFIRGGFQ